MKRIISVLLILMLLPVSAMATSFEWLDSEPETIVTTVTTDEAWYEISADDTVLTVRMPGNTKTGLAWEHEISDPFALELLTMETLVGESEGMAGAPTSYVASFRAIGNAKNAARLILRCVDENDPAAAAEHVRVLELSVSADNRISVSSVLTQEPFADWCEYGDGGCILTVRLPGSGWDYSIVDPEIVELVRGENAADGFTTSFMATMNKAGNAEIVFAREDGSESRAVDVFVNESGMIDVVRVGVFEVFETPELVYCDVCGGWYEAGNIFRNHICVSRPVEPQATAFRTVNITGGSVNMREGAGTGYDVVTVLKKGANARYLENSQYDDRGVEWHNVSIDGKYGWVSSQYAKLGGKGYVKIVNGNCNMRREPGLDSEVLTVISKDAIITYLGEGSTDARGVDWYRVSASGKEGWVSSQYAKFVASATQSAKTNYKYVLISGGSCHLRKSPSVDAASLKTVKEGAYIKYLGEKSTDERGVDWYKASYDGKTGWVSSKYAKLKKDKPVQPTKAPSSNDDSDMRLVYNPNRYDVLRVSDIYSLNGRDYFVTGCFGKINKNGEPEYFDDRKTVTMALVSGAEVMLPSDPDDPADIGYVDQPEIWFNDVRNYYGGGSYSFYATFSMNESGALRSLVYREVY